MQFENDVWCVLFKMERPNQITIPRIIRLMAALLSKRSIHGKIIGRKNI